MFSENIFREYDIRGVADKEFDVQFAYDLGLSYSSLLIDENKEKNSIKVSVGQDNRPTGEKYKQALIQAIIDSGIDVIELGVVTTPVTYFSTHYYNLDGGIMVSASHNPSEYNGFKISLGKSSIYGEALQDLKNRIKNKNFKKTDRTGSIESVNILDIYISNLAKQFSLTKPIKVVLDAGNAVGALTAPKLYREIGCQVEELFCELDGTFPNHHPDPTVVKNLEPLISKVKSGKYDLGISLDGDADRIGVVDHTGSIIWGDQLMIIFSRDVLKSNPGATIISEVKSSKNLYEDIRKNGGNGIMYKTGHSLIKKKMKETGALLAGEMSGHMFFADKFYGFDDAVYAGARLLEIMDKTGKKIPELLEGIPHTFTTPEIRIDVDDSKKFKVVEIILKYFKKNYEVIDVDGARINFETGWGLVRASNTQPALVLRFEADSEKNLAEIKELVEQKVYQEIS